MKTYGFSRNSLIILFAVILFSVLGKSSEAVAQQASDPKEIPYSQLEKLLQTKVPGLRIQIDSGKMFGGSRTYSNMMRVILTGYRKRREELA